MINYFYFSREKALLVACYQDEPIVIIQGMDGETWTSVVVFPQG